MHHLINHISQNIRNTFTPKETQIPRRLYENTQGDDQWLQNHALISLVTSLPLGLEVLLILENFGTKQIEFRLKNNHIPGLKPDKALIIIKSMKDYLTKLDGYVPNTTFVQATCLEC